VQVWAATTDGKRNFPMCAKTDREMQNTDGEKEKQFPGIKRQGKRKLLVGFVTHKENYSISFLIVYRGEENPTGKNTYTVRTTHFLIKTTSFLCPFY
jgi:hypothetical protein